MFKLIKSLETKTHIIDLKLCRVLLEDKEYPWLLLIPMEENIIQIDELCEKDCFQLMKEIKLASKIMNNLFSPDRLNIAAIGNKTPQLHIHIVARKQSDPLWPETVWGKEMKSLTSKELIDLANLLKKEFSRMMP